MDGRSGAAGGQVTGSEAPSAVRTLLVLVMVAQPLFWSAWWLGYTFLPEGVLRGRSAASLLPLESLGGGVRLLAVLVSRAGIFELSGYLLVAAATAGWSRWQQQHWWGGPTRRVQPRPMGPAEWIMLAAAALLLIAGAVRELRMWCGAGGGC